MGNSLGVYGVRSWIGSYVAILNFGRDARGFFVQALSKRAAARARTDATGAVS